MRSFVMRALTSLFCFSGIFTIPIEVQASAFQLWEQDVASLGHYHAGYAALANDASTAWYNPAGMTRIKDQQLVLGAIAVVSSFKFRGSVIVTEPPFTEFFTNIFPEVTSQGGNFSFVPNLHYVAPINDCISFGFSIVVPFGLKTDYGRNSPLRYAATLTSISVIDFSPSLAVKITDHASIGAGLDIQKNDAEIDMVGKITFLTDFTDTYSTNRLTGVGYGFHAGILYEFTPCARAGLSYHSQVRHHLSGSSKFTGPIADILNDDLPFASKRARTNITLPPYTALSYYQDVSPCLSLMATAIYTRWSTIDNLILNDYAGAISPEEFLIELSRNIQVVVPEHFRNTWNLAIGADYHVNDRIIIRGGVGYDETPVKTRFRNVQLPDNNRYVFSLGGHYQATRCLGFDIGWLHVIAGQAHVNPPPQAMGGQTVITNGRVTGGADVYGASVTWNM